MEGVRLAWNGGFYSQAGMEWRGSDSPVHCSSQLETAG